jgi:hypothetical protein
VFPGADDIGAGVGGDERSEFEVFLARVGHREERRVDARFLACLEPRAGR